MKESTTPDKYDEAAAFIANESTGGVKDKQALAAFLRSAFPPALRAAAEPAWDYSDCLEWAAQDEYGRWCRAASPEALRDCDRSTLVRRPPKCDVPSIAAPPAEDARALVDRVRTVQKLELKGERHYFVWDISSKEAAAEIERFAESRVEPWRETLRRMTNRSNRITCPFRHQHSVKAIQPADIESLYASQLEAEALLSDSPAKEAAP